MPVYCKYCGSPMNPVQAVLGFDKISNEFICHSCTIKKHKEAISKAPNNRYKQIIKNKPNKQ